MLGPNQTPLPISFKKLPKTEQHVHIEGTTSLELLEKMAYRNGMQDIFQDLKPLLYQFNAKNFSEFLTAYDLISLFINTPEDVEDMVIDYLRRCKSEGLTHVALTCSYDHTKVERDIYIDFEKDAKDYTEVEAAADKVRKKLKASSNKAANLTYQQYVDAVASAIAKGMAEGISAEIIMVKLRHNPIEQANELLDHIQAYPHPDVSSIGLAGDEVRNPASKFSASFTRARDKLGLKIVPHVCELAPPEYLEAALTEMGPLCRVGHAITAPSNPAVMERLYDLSNPAIYFLKRNDLSARTRELLQQLAAHGILENDVDEANLKQQLLAMNFQDKQSKECLDYLFQPLCVELSLTSNLLLIGNINSLEDHPIKAFIKSGIRISINSDDPKFWSDRVKGAEHFEWAHFDRSPLGCSVGSEWEKVQRLYQLTDAQMLKIYRDSVVSMGCHKLLKIRLLKYADLYESYHHLKNNLNPQGNTKLIFEAYENNPTEENAQAILRGVESLNDFSDLNAEVALASAFVAKHDAFAKAVDAHLYHRMSIFSDFKAQFELNEGFARKDKALFC